MSNGKAEIYFNDKLVGILSRDNGKYYFQYAAEYIEDDKNPAISLTLPKQTEIFTSEYLFPFFYGFLAEGDNKKLQCRKLKIDENDNFTRLLKTASNDTIGGITVREL